MKETFSRRPVLGRERDNENIGRWCSFVLTGCDRMIVAPGAAAKMQDVEWTKFGRDVRKHRQEAGLSLRELAPIIGVHYAVLQRTEKGRRLPTVGEFLRLCLWMNVGPYEHFGKLGSPSNRATKQETPHKPVPGAKVPKALICYKCGHHMKFVGIAPRAAEKPATLIYRCESCDRYGRVQAVKK